MELPVALIILLITLIVLALAVFLIGTIVELGKINHGLDGRPRRGRGDRDEDRAGERRARRDQRHARRRPQPARGPCAQEDRAATPRGWWSRASPAKVRSSCGASAATGTVVHIGETYPRGEATLNALLGARPRGGARSPKPVGRLSAMGARPWE